MQYNNYFIIYVSVMITYLHIRPYYRCPACGVDMSKHKRHIVHGASAIYINMQMIDHSLLGNDDGIYTWLACKHCAQVYTHALCQMHTHTLMCAHTHTQLTKLPSCDIMKSKKDFYPVFLSSVRIIRINNNQQ